MTEHHDPHAEVHASVPLYVGVFVALLALTAVTVLVARVDLGPLNNTVALGVAFTKALLVISFFMHARWAGRLVVLVVGSGFVFLGILLFFLMSDYVTRGWSLVG